MKKCSTSVNAGATTGTSEQGCRALTPSKTTIAMLRQLARAYRPVNGAALPGYVLN